MDVTVNAMGDTCPIPIIKTKKAIQEMKESGTVFVQVDNEIAVQNLLKMAKQKNMDASYHKAEENAFAVTILVKEEQLAGLQDKAEEEPTQEESCMPASKRKTVVVVSSDEMGTGNPELGAVLMKGFLYALTKQSILPDTMLFYNKGASLTCKGSASLEDVVFLAEQGVTVLTCGTCLNFYNLTDTLAVGSITNMYDITEIMMQADHIVKPS